MDVDDSKEVIIILIIKRYEEGTSLRTIMKLNGAVFWSFIEIDEKSRIKIY